MKKLLALAAAGAACLLSACANQPTHDPVAGHDRASIHTHGSTAQTAPPALRQETVAAVPGPRALYAWDPGHWRWSGSDYDWSPGRWIKRPYVNAEWVPARWMKRGDHWELVEGHWSA
jgi:hypothetical protein